MEVMQLHGQLPKIALFIGNLFRLSTRLLRTGKLIGLTVRCILLALYLKMYAWHSLLVGWRVEFNLIPPRISSEKGTRPF